MTLQEVNTKFKYVPDKSLDSWTGLQDVDGKLVGDCEDYCITLKREVKYFKNWDYYYCKVNGNGHCILSDGKLMIDCNLKAMYKLDWYKSKSCISNVKKFSWFIVVIKLFFGKITKMLK